MRDGRIAGLVAVLVGIATVTTGCTASAPGAVDSPAVTPSSTPSSTSVSAAAGTPADRLAGLVAAAADQHYVARYDYTPTGQRSRTVTVTLADDGSWRVDVPAAGLGGDTDVSVAGTRDGVYQCGLGAHPSCGRVADRDGSVPAKYDPRVERLFTEWIGRLGDRDAALSVAPAPRPHGVAGTCFSVEPTAASLASPVPSGVYCLADDGTVTGVRLGLGALTLTGDPAPAPSSVTLPGPVTGGGAVPTRSPSPSPSPGASTSGPE